MAHWHPSYCRVCGKRRSPDEPISAKGFCLEHGVGRMDEHNRQLAAHDGPWFESWRRSMAATVLPPAVVAMLAEHGAFGDLSDDG